MYICICMYVYACMYVFVCMYIVRKSKPQDCRVVNVTVKLLVINSKKKPLMSHLVVF
jgi:hypothetical protein